MPVHSTKHLLTHKRSPVRLHNYEYALDRARVVHHADARAFAYAAIARACVRLRVCALDANDPQPETIKRSPRP
eukprot:6201718-Pleurochrysis_carterae.AAC.2